MFNAESAVQLKETNEVAALQSGLSKRCSIDIGQILMREQELIKDYERLNRAIEQLRKLLSTNPGLLRNPKTKREIELIKELDKRWNCEVGFIQTQRMLDRYNSRHNTDELLASIQRGRWCYICCSAAHILDDELGGKFFCSIECQLNYYDS
ncbi:hypothetical protein ACLKA7_012433 [Drosophila subpalustris]